MFRRNFLALWAALLCSASTIGFAQPSGELIVLLPFSADPPTVVDLIRGGGPYPYGLETGKPTGARLALPERPTGRTLQWIQLNHQAPLAKLYRYIVLEYAEGTDVRNVRDQLQAGGQLESVEENLPLRLAATHTSAIPNDPFFGNLFGDVNAAQWATHLLNLPAAWDWTTGNAQIGIVDTGVELEHPELKAYQRVGNDWQWVGGNLRPHRSVNVTQDVVGVVNPCFIDEIGPGDLNAGHGTHVAGLIGAHTNNNLGVTGACWGCSLLVGKAFEDPENDVASMQLAATASIRLLGQGSQVLNFSFGSPEIASCSTSPNQAFCNTLNLAFERAVVTAASSGNDRATLNFPASEPSVIAVGGVQRTPVQPFFQLWDEITCPVIPDLPPGRECGSNFGFGQDFVAPAKQVLSTLYTNRNHNPYILCGDGAQSVPGLPPIPGIAGDGLGTCTGTSMAAPLVTGSLGLVRSVDPFLGTAEVFDVLASTASHAASPNQQLGYGIPNAEGAVKRALGTVHGQQIANRLTPLLSLRSLANEAHFYATAPQEAAALTFDGEDPFDTFGPVVFGYQIPGACSISPCPPNAATASLFLWTSAKTPHEGSPPLQPLYRLRYDPRYERGCAGEEPPPTTSRRFAYALAPLATPGAELEYFRNTTVDANEIGYAADTLLGYLYPWCSPHLTCRPPGTVAVYRLYHAGKDDWALVPEPERQTYEDGGYHAVSAVPAGVGFAYYNTDADQDELIDGWENVLGTSPTTSDTDCDGQSDGFEIRSYSLALHGRRDPLDGPCFPFFRDGFETGSTNRWSSAAGAAGSEENSR